jgi:hypothetical protein
VPAFFDEETPMQTEGAVGSDPQPVTPIDAIKTHFKVLLDQRIEKELDDFIRERLETVVLDIFSRWLWSQATTLLVLAGAIVVGFGLARLRGH